MSELRDLQNKHCKYTALLIQFIQSKGYRLRWGQTMRTQAEANANAANGSGIVHSLHLLGLAVDLPVYTADDVWLTHTEDYAEFGAYWKSLDPLCCWGGDFKPPAVPDGNHFSITYQDRK